jgi:hypothetical protein
VIVGAWARAEITNRYRYVDTVAPLADDPQVQRYVAGGSAPDVHLGRLPVAAGT